VQRKTNRKLRKIKAYILDSIDELKNKVAWPKYSELQNSSVLVLVASIIFALVIGGIDLVFDFVMNLVYGIDSL
jgi:preprotein translocase subunit SecE